MTRTWICGTTTLLLLAACAHSKAESAPVEVAAPQATEAAPPPPPAQSAGCAQDTDCGAGRLCLRSTCVDIRSALPECEHVWIHFAFDQAELSSQDLPLLQRVNRCLSARSSFRVRIEGNTDERGTAEYNLLLGDRRASAVEHYLERLGTAKAQLETVSFGKEKPICTSHDEDCWAKNRRAMVRNLDLADAAD